MGPELTHSISECGTRAIVKNNPALSFIKRTWVVQHHIQRVRERAARVAEKGYHAAVDVLVLGPRRHDSAVVHAVHQHLIDAAQLERILLLKVARHLV